MTLRSAAVGCEAQTLFEPGLDAAPVHERKVVEGSKVFAIHTLEKLQRPGWPWLGRVELQTRQPPGVAVDAEPVGAVGAVDPVDTFAAAFNTSEGAGVNGGNTSAWFGTHSP
jgi:hypothetical protein